jgi:hypothetical protein
MPLQSVTHSLLIVVNPCTDGQQMIRSSLLDILRRLDQSVEEHGSVVVELILLARALIYECVEAKGMHFQFHSFFSIDFPSSHHPLRLFTDLSELDKSKGPAGDSEGIDSFEECKIELQKHSKCPASVEPVSYLTDLLRRCTLATKEPIVDDFRRRIIAVSFVHVAWTRDSVEFLIRCIRSDKLLSWKDSSLLALAAISKYPIGADIIDLGIGPLFSLAMSPFPVQNRLLVSYILQNIITYSPEDSVLKKLLDISSRKSYNYRFATSILPS